MIWNLYTIAFTATIATKFVSLFPTATIGTFTELVQEIKEWLVNFFIKSERWFALNNGAQC